jgi:hypothetical protein
MTVAALGGVWDHDQDASCGEHRLDVQSALSRRLGVVDEHPVGRRFTLLDGMILTAALAVCFASRSYAPSEVVARFRTIPAGYLASWDGWLMILRGKSPEAVAFSGTVFTCLLPYLAFGTVASLAVRLRNPRPPRDQLVRQPGLIACAAAVTGWALASWLPDHVFSLSAVGLTVGAAWLVLALSRRWRAEPSWVDRFGRAMGVLWIATLPWLFWYGSQW